jgi:ESF2/ABP1 family protein
MADINKRDWFATGDSDEEEQGYNSDVAEESKGRSFTSKGSKRRKLDNDASDAEDGESDNETGTSFEKAKESLQGTINRDGPKNGDLMPEDEDEGTGGLDVKPAISALDKAKIVRKLAKAQAKASKTGVLYISRVPPFMKPHTLKHLLEPFAPSGLDRIFLTPEDPETHKSRVKGGGNKKKLFLDGWVEFVSKREAKLAAETLNGKNIGGKKGNYYYDDVWNLKYLKGFKWRHLTEQIANENAERAARLRAETTRERKEAKEFLRNVERAKMLDGIEKKRKIKGGRDHQDLEQQSSDRKKGKDPMQFRQREAVSKTKKSKGEQPSADTQRVLSKIF